MAAEAAVAMNLFDNPLAKCVAYAALGGISASAGSNVVAYVKKSAHYQRRHREFLEGKEAGDDSQEIAHWEEVLLYIANVGLNLGSIAGFLVAAQYGPVSIAMPILTAAKLFSNLLFQVWAGLGMYNRQTRIGTSVLCGAVVCLIEQGPVEPEHPDMVALLEHHMAKIWLLIVASIMLVSWCVITCEKTGFKSDAPAQSEFDPNAEKAHKALKLKGVIHYSFVVATSTALGASVGKSFSLLSGEALIASIVSYLCLGAVSFYYSAKATFLFELEQFMTVSECIQLSVNAVNGLCIWQDWKSLQEHNNWITYAAIYWLIIQGAMLCTDIDVLGDYVERHQKHWAYGKILVRKITPKKKSDQSPPLLSGRP